MQKKTWLVGLLVALVFVFALVFPPHLPSRQVEAAPNQQSPAVTLETVASGFTRPLYITHAGDDSGRLFVVEQGGKIKIVQAGAVLPDPFLDVSGLISQSALGGQYTEQGLLGLAFDPDYATTGKFYINYTDQRGNSVVSRMNVSADDPNRADPESATQLLYLPQPYRNHNGGHMAFGPDGYLYVSFGDGGSGGDPDGNGQNLATLLGTILRLDVRNQDMYAIPADNPFRDDPNARPEIWAWGLRNVWRFSFDRDTGDLYLGDVGQNQWEEINFQPADSPGGVNYGWNTFEAGHIYSNDGGPASTVSEGPILEYEHRNGWCSVTGGYMYRGTTVPSLQGYYVYGDYCTGTIWAAHQDDAGTWTASIMLEAGFPVSSFGEDQAGELYVLNYNGAILRFNSAN